MSAELAIVDDGGACEPVLVFICPAALVGDEVDVNGGGLYLDADDVVAGGDDVVPADEALDIVVLRDDIVDSVAVGCVVAPD